MDLKDLKMLLALAEHRHFARAAEACAISQPAFSERLRRLEADLGAPLVLRGQRFQGFTREGERALVWARTIIAGVEGLAQDVTATRRELEGQLRIGAVPSVLPYAGRLAAAFGALHPRVAMTVISSTSNEIVRGLDTFERDCGITYVGNEPLRHVRAMTLFEERYMLVAPPALAGGEGAITWAEAARLPLALLVVEMQNRRIIDAAFREAGVRPTARIETNSFSVAAGAVREGATAAVLPAAYAEQLRFGDDAVMHTLTGPSVAQTVGLIVPDREPALPLVEAFWAFAESFARRERELSASDS